MNAVRQLFAVQEAGDPFAIPPSPVTCVPLRFRDAEAVYNGPVSVETFIGTLREDTASGLVVALTRGNAGSAADKKSFHTRGEAVSWLRRAIDGVIPKKGTTVRRFRTYGKGKATP